MKAKEWGYSHIAHIRTFLLCLFFLLEFFNPVTNSGRAFGLFPPDVSQSK